MLITVVADYGTGDLAFAEVRQTFAELLPEAEIAALPVPAFDTVSAGFCVAQLAFGAGPADRVVYADVAAREDEDQAREDEDQAREDDAGERLVAARLPTGVLVVGVDSGAGLSFLADEGVELRAVKVSDAGSQFRPRDMVPAAVAALVRGDDNLLGEVVSVGPAPRRSVVYTDGYGNLKTSWFEAPAATGTTLRVRIGEAVAEATVTDGVFAVPAGAVSFAPGSSGWGDRTCYELLVRGDNAADLFDFPPSGTPVEILPEEQAAESRGTRLAQRS